MSDVFVSYASEDQAWAEQLVRALEERGRDAFFARHIPIGSDWARKLESELEASKCVVVLWSEHSVRSLWVRAEAAEALGRNTLLQITLPDVVPPPLFRRGQAAIVASPSDTSSPEFVRLLDAIEGLTGGPAHRGLRIATAPSPVAADSLALIHSCWRRADKDVDYPGRQMYQIHVVLYGHASTLDRVEKVTYRLSGYPEHRSEQETDVRSRNFELKELAWGWSLLRADVHLRDQPEGHPNPLRLFRFINMSESGPRLDPFMNAMGGWASS